LSDEMGNVEILDQSGLQRNEFSELQHVEDSPNVSRKIPTTSWIYFPWKKSFVRILSEDAYRRVRTSRNKFLISEDEAKKLSVATVAVAGLNVGGAGAFCLALEGIATSMKLADFDPLSLSNLNRFQSNLFNLGINKAALIARSIFEVDPYYKIEVYGDGIDVSNADAFLSDPSVDLLIEEVDDLKIKILLREMARDRGIPVLMVTGNSDGIIVDVERFDVDPELSLLSGHLNDDILTRIKETDLTGLSKKEYALLCRDFIGKEHLAPRLNMAFEQIGDSIGGIPQLAEATFLRGAALAFFSRQIITNADLVSGRYKFGFDPNNLFSYEH